jgi:hypothetical protein
LLPSRKAEPSPISARIRAPVRGPIPGRDASSSPKGWARNASSISVARASRRPQTRWAEVEELPGCFAAGRDESELREALAEAISFYLSEPGHEVHVELEDKPTR